MSVKLASTHKVTTVDGFTYYGLRPMTDASGDVTLVRLALVSPFGRFRAHAPVVVTVLKRHLATLVLTDRAVTWTADE